MNEAQTESLLQFFKAVGQPERVKILGLLANQPYSVADLSELLAMRETAVIHHLNKLKKARLVRENSVAYTYTYEVNNETLDRLNGIILEDAPALTFAERVLQKYVPDGQTLKDVPLDPEERLVILQWLAEDFEAGRQYNLAEVNEIIARHYRRQNQLRWSLLSAQLLKHVGNTFWRPEVD
jgi:DNA-binding transcriptional ArsR family regulator